MARRRISQRDAAMWKRRALAAEAIANVDRITPAPRLEICRFTLDNVMAAKMRGAEYFGATIRVERYGDEFRVYAYLAPVTP